MNILVTGGTGFIGSSLCARLLEGKHHIVVLTRQPALVMEGIEVISNLSQMEPQLTLDVVINLAGESIASKRWTKVQKQRIFDSRLEMTRKLIDFFKAAANKPKFFISSSAIGYYGVSESNHQYDESALGDESFSSRLCLQWEAVASEAETIGIRTCVLRTGIVLGKGGGALQKMLLPFKFGLGGRIGKGSQWMSWIHIDDLVGIILYCIENHQLTGPVNGTAPTPVTNAAFTKTLGKVLKRPAIVPMPAIVIKIVMGKMGEELLLAGKKVLPTKITTAGYNFKFPHLEDALLNSI